MGGPLGGIRVLDLTRILAGPYCTMYLCDLGAEVIKIERPQGGDIARGNGPFIDDMSTFFLSLNRGKKSVTLELGTPAGKKVFKELVQHADVLVENFVPGAMRRLGLDYAALSEVNPRLIYCAISGFGQDGPYAQRRALDIVVQAMGGIMSITGEEHGPPVRPGVSIGDIAAGLNAAIAILAAVIERGLSGQGQMIDISMLDCQLALQENAFVRYLNLGEIPKPLGTRHPVVTPVQAFQTQDGWVAVAIVGGVNDQWPLFCAAIDRPELIDDPRFTTSHLRTVNYLTLEPLMSQPFRQRATAEWLERFQKAGIACSPINTIDQVADHPQVQMRGMIADIPWEGHASVRVVNSPLRFQRTPPAVERMAPTLGEHTEIILQDWIGLDAAQITALRATGVV